MVKLVLFFVCYSSPLPQATSTQCHNNRNGYLVSFLKYTDLASLVFSPLSLLISPARIRRPSLPPLSPPKSEPFPSHSNLVVLDVLVATARSRTCFSSVFLPFQHVKYDVSLSLSPSRSLLGVQVKCLRHKIDGFYSLRWCKRKCLAWLAGCFFLRCRHNLGLLIYRVLARHSTAVYFEQPNSVHNGPPDARVAWRAGGRAGGRSTAPYLAAGKLNFAVLLNPNMEGFAVATTALQGWPGLAWT